jgi:hypothetical protein
MASVVNIWRMDCLSELAVSFVFQKLFLSFAINS